MLKVWIAGAEGQIGTAINEILDPLEMETFNTDRAELDITNTDEVLSFGEINRPDVIINCAAITDIALCEQNPELAYRVNALGARNLSLVARKVGAKRHQSPDGVRCVQAGGRELCEGVHPQAFYHPEQLGIRQGQQLCEWCAGGSQKGRKHEHSPGSIRQPHQC